MAPLVWLVTGTTSGFGTAFVHDITSRGDKVIATGRDVEAKIGHLRSESVAVLELDVSSDLAYMKSKIKEAWDIFGHVDVLVNNAGMIGTGTVEDADDDFIQHIFNINTFGPMRLAQATLPYFRERGRGLFVFISSGGANNPMPFQVYYNASKAALTNLAYGLSAEVRSFGLHCMVVEPGGSKTALGAPRPGKPFGEGIGASPPPPAYKPLYDEFIGAFAKDPDLFMIGDPARGVKAIVDSVKGEGVAKGKKCPPLHLALGSDSLGTARLKAKVALKRLDEWETVSRSGDRDGASEESVKILARLSAGLTE